MSVRFGNVAFDATGRDIVYISDSGGKSVRMQRFEGRYLNSLYEPRTLRQMVTVELRPDDIYLAAFPRTGTHWVFEMIYMLINGNADTVLKYKGQNQLEYVPNDELSCLPSPRVINTHQWLSHGPRDLKSKKCKIVYPMRDPKDVVVSLYKRFVDMKMYDDNDPGTFEGFLELFLQGKVDANGLFEHWKDAERFRKENPDIPFHVMYFEDTIENPQSAVQKLSDFLGLARNSELCGAIADKCSFANMAVDKERCARIVDEKNVLYRKGIVGDWKNWFTDKMLSDYYSAYSDNLKGTCVHDRYARK